MHERRDGAGKCKGGELRMYVIISAYLCLNEPRQVAASSAESAHMMLPIHWTGASARTGIQQVRKKATLRQIDPTYFSRAPTVAPLRQRPSPLLFPSVFLVPLIYLSSGQKTVDASISRFSIHFVDCGGGSGASTALPLPFPFCFVEAADTPASVRSRIIQSENGRRLSTN